MGVGGLAAEESQVTDSVFLCVEISFGFFLKEDLVLHVVGLFEEVVEIVGGLGAAKGGRCAINSSFLTVNELPVPPLHKLSFTCLHHESKAASESPEREQWE